MEGGKAHLVSARQQTDEVQCWSHLWWNTCSEKGAPASGVLQQVPRKPKGGSQTKVVFYDSLASHEHHTTKGTDLYPNDVTSDPTTVAGLLLLLKSYDRNKHSSDQQLAQADLTSTHNLTVIYRHCLDMTRHLTVLRGKKYNLIIIGSVMRKVN